MKRRLFFYLFGLTPLGIFLKGSSPLLKAKRGSALTSSPSPSFFSSDLKSRPQTMDPWIEIDLRALRKNFLQIKKKAKVKVMGVVKANAYGHGLIEVSKALEEAGIDWLMVGKIDEALCLRRAGLKTPILNFGPFDRHQAEAIVEYNISQSVYTDDVFQLAEVAAKKNQKVSVHVDLDTGMGRTGLPYSKALPFIEKIASHPHLRLEGLSTTLTEDLDFDREQVHCLNEVYNQAKQKGFNCGLRHAASSAGLLASSEFFLDMVRPGITLYGYYPNEKTQKEDPLDLQPVLRLKAKVIYIKELNPGETLSYHRVFKAAKKMRVATLSLGYSDGYQPQLGGRAWALIKKKKFPVLPLVTANHLMIDLENDQEIKIGDEVLLLDTEKNSDLTADKLASSSGISTYRLLIGLNPHLPRSYFHEELH